MVLTKLVRFVLKSCGLSIVGLQIQETLFLYVGPGSVEGETG